MVQQAKSMSPAQQQALAKQLGVDMPSDQGVDAPTTSNEQNNDRFEDYLMRMNDEMISLIFS